MPSYLFVYGTLMRKLPRNEWSAFLQENAPYVGEAKTIGELYLVASYPGLIINGDKEVFGELYEIIDPEKLFHFLDQYEDYRPEDHKNSLYLRTKIEVTFDSNLKSVLASTYLYNQSTNGLKIIKNGRFETI